MQEPKENDEAKFNETLNRMLETPFSPPKGIGGGKSRRQFGLGQGQNNRRNAKKA
jgi:hypothetical protein